MPFLQHLAVRNFKCFRQREELELEQATYLVGPNNSGKTALLEALNCFFDSTAFRAEYLHRTELRARLEGYNRADIAVTFNVAQISQQRRRRDLIKKYGSQLEIEKRFTWREASDTVLVEFNFAGESCLEDELPPEVSRLLRAGSMSYLHPQEGSELLARAQDKFKQRLFHNWGRHASVADRVKAAQAEWSQLRSTANTYLSAALTSRLKTIWPQADLKVDLPERIQDIVAVSDISFRSSPNLPQITLTQHGTGAQSAILYQTHYVLDSDRSLHQGMYFPVWLLEEPESFLHADIANQLAQLLSSQEWLDSIQMIISTHSPLILAASRQSADRASWVLLDSHAVKWQRRVADVKKDDIEEMGRMLGDANFGVYFDSSTVGPRVFIEDSRQALVNALVDLDVSVTKALGGISNAKRYLEVFEALQTLPGETYFLVDGDRARDLGPRLEQSRLVMVLNGWCQREVADRCFVVVTPPDTAMEDCFEGWPDVLLDCANEIYDGALNLRDPIPLSLSRAVASLRGKSPGSIDDAKLLLRSQQDVKDRFWNDSSPKRFTTEATEAIAAMLPRANTEEEA